MALTEAQREHYVSQGYVSQVDVLSEAEAAAYLERFERLVADEVAAQGGQWKERDYRPRKGDDSPYPLKAWAWELLRTPALLEAASSLLGPDLLVRNVDIFYKPAKWRRAIGWHLDTAMRAPEVDHIITAWLGLTPSTATNGGLRFLPGSHRREIPHGPRDKFTLTLNARALAHIDESEAVDNEMAPGQMSMHHFSMVHGSGANTTRAPRLGFVVRFMSPKITQAIAESGQAVLLQGRNHPANLQLKEQFPITWGG